MHLHVHACFCSYPDTYQIQIAGYIIIRENLRFGVHFLAGSLSVNVLGKF